MKSRFPFWFLTVQIALCSSVLFFGNLLLLLSRPTNLVVFQPTAGFYLRLSLAFAVMSLLQVALLFECHRRYPAHYPKLGLLLLCLSLYNLSDFVVQSLFPTGAERMKLAVLVLFGTLYVPLAIWIGWKYGTIQVVKKVRAVLLPVALIILVYGLPQTLFLGTIQRPYIPAKHTPIHLIICDGLSWDVLYKDAGVDPEFANVLQISHDAHLCTNADSGGNTTKEALAGMITGRDFDGAALRHTRWLVSDRSPEELPENPDTWTSIGQFGSIFEDTRRAGYNNVLVGYYLPYLETFTEHITRGYQIPHISAGRMTFQQTPRSLLFPVHRSTAKNFERAFDYYLDQVSQAPDNTFFYVHLNLPHSPFCYDPAGNVLGRFAFYRNSFVESDLPYRNNIRKLDASFGRLIKALKTRGTYDDSLLIITSDHNVNYTSSHVPLIVKMPGQQTPIVVKDEVSLSRVKAFLADVLAGEALDIAKLRPTNR